MPLLLRSCGPIAFMVLAVSTVSPAATPKEIDAAIQKGAKWLKSNYGKGAGPGGNMYGVGSNCLAGLALLEAGTPVDDPAIKSIAAIVRDKAYTENRTYHISLCVMFLDRLGEPADVPLIQALAARLIVGQSINGGWNYDVCKAVPADDVQFLKAIKPDQKPGKLHPDVEKYGNELARRRAAGAGGGADIGSMGGADNSNTQFAVIAVWMARKHGVPVEGALDLIEKRFMTTQNLNTGGWNYSGAGKTTSFSPSMHCAGLIGMSTAIARREDRLKKAELVKKKDPPPMAVTAGGNKKVDDPFFHPPVSSGSDPKKPKPPARHQDDRDRVIQFGMNGLGMILAESVKAGRGSLYLSDTGVFGMHDLYFYWSLERVGVIYGIEKLGGVDWYDSGANTLVRVQATDGNWFGRYGGEVDTSFAVLFLCKSNLARDLSSKVQKEVSTEMRAGVAPVGSSPKPKEPGTSASANAIIPNPVIRGPEGSEAAVLAGELLRSSDKDWAVVLKKLRDSKGAINTAALVAAASRLEGTRVKEARAALAERLTRMTAETLRTMAKDEEIELRRGAVLAMAMKDDKAHIPDLVNALLDDEELVIRAAKAGLKSMAGQDFGPRVNATAGDKKLAVTAWNEWLAKQKR